MRAETELVYRERIGKVLAHIQRHLDKPLALEELSRLACFSPFHFHRIFRGLVGESLQEHVRRLRLERALADLRGSKRRVIDIALDAGYETHESFTRAFRSRFGETPSRVRRSRSFPLKTVANRVHYRPDGDITMFRPQTGRRKIMIKVEIKKFEPIRVACVRHTGPYQECHGAWTKLCGWAGKKGLLGPGTVAIGISYDDPAFTPQEKLRYDACVTVGAEVVPGDPDIGIKTIPGGEYAVTLHQGPFENLAKTYQALCGDWAPKSGRVLSPEASYEVYLTDPDRTPPEKLLTEIRMKLES